MYMLARLKRRLLVWLYNRRGRMPWLGGEIFFPQYSMIASSLMSAGGWEKDVTRMLTTASKPGTTAFDIGANIGSSALAILDLFPDIQVVSFEPSPTILPYLKKTRENSRFRDRWQITPKAVADRAGLEVPFTIYEGAGADVFEGFKDTGRSGRPARQMTVPTTTVDAEWRALGKPTISVIKIDVEGAELAVLGGAVECLRFCRPVIVTEWCSKNFSAYGNSIGDIISASKAASYTAYVIPELTEAKDDKLFPYQLADRENLLLLPNIIEHEQ